MTDDLERLFCCIERESTFKPIDKALVLRNTLRWQRDRVVEWIYAVGADMEPRFQNDTCAMAVRNFDRALMLLEINRDTLQLLAITTLLIAAKLNEREAPPIYYMTAITQNTYTGEHIRAMELLVLKALEWRAQPVLPQYIFQLALKCLPPHQYPHAYANKLMATAELLVELASRDLDLVVQRPSVLVFACLSLAADHVHGDVSPWERLLQPMVKADKALVKQLKADIRSHWMACYPAHFGLPATNTAQNQGLNIPFVESEAKGTDAAAKAGTAARGQDGRRSRREVLRGRQDRSIPATADAYAVFIPAKRATAGDPSPARAVSSSVASSSGAAATSFVRSSTSAFSARKTTYTPQKSAVSGSASVPASPSAFVATPSTVASPSVASVASVASAGSAFSAAAAASAASAAGPKSAPTSATAMTVSSVRASTTATASQMVATTTTAKAAVAAALASARASGRVTPQPLSMDNDHDEESGSAADNSDDYLDEEDDLLDEGDDEGDFEDDLDALHQHERAREHEAMRLRAAEAERADRAYIASHGHAHAQARSQAQAHGHAHAHNYGTHAQAHPDAYPHAHHGHAHTYAHPHSHAQSYLHGHTHPHAQSHPHAHSQIADRSGSALVSTSGKVEAKAPQQPQQQQRQQQQQHQAERTPVTPVPSAASLSVAQPQTLPMAHAVPISQALQLHITTRDARAAANAHALTNGSSTNASAEEHLPLSQRSTASAPAAVERSPLSDFSSPNLSARSMSSLSSAAVASPFAPRSRSSSRSSLSNPTANPHAHTVAQSASSAFTPTSSRAPVIPESPGSFSSAGEPLSSGSVASLSLSMMTLDGSHDHEHEDDFDVSDSSRLAGEVHAFELESDSSASAHSHSHSLSGGVGHGVGQGHSFSQTHSHRFTTPHASAPAPALGVSDFSAFLSSVSRPSAAGSAKRPRDPHDETVAPSEALNRVQHTNQHQHQQLPAAALAPALVVAHGPSHSYTHTAFGSAPASASASVTSSASASTAAVSGTDYSPKRRRVSDEHYPGAVAAAATAGAGSVAGTAAGQLLFMPTSPASSWMPKASDAVFRSSLGPVGHGHVDAGAVVDHAQLAKNYFESWLPPAAAANGHLPPQHQQYQRQRQQQQPASSAAHTLAHMHARTAR